MLYKDSYKVSKVSDKVDIHKYFLYIKDIDYLHIIYRHHSEELYYNHIDYINQFLYKADNSGHNLHILINLATDKFSRDKYCSRHPNKENFLATSNVHNCLRKDIQRKKRHRLCRFALFKIYRHCCHNVTHRFR